jgi:hypothetical protein
MTDLPDMNEKAVSTPSLLAVDAGLRCGLALFDLSTGTLRWFRSHNFGSVPRLRRASASLINEIPDLVACVIEGGGMIADPWMKTLAFRRIEYHQISAEQWRPSMLLSRERRNGADAKKAALSSARHSIANAADKRAKSLTDDTAEAIMIGEWALLNVAVLFPTIAVRKESDNDESAR